MMIKHPIIKKSLADEVAQQLQQYISAGRYKAGEKLPTEVALMDHFQVGRSTIREAIRILTNSNVVFVQHGVGIFVHEAPETGEPLSRRLKRAQIENIAEVKLLLEMKIAENAALHRQAGDIKRMKELLKQRKQHAEAGEVDACVKADVSFHIVIAEACGNDILTDLYKAFGKQFMESYLLSDMGGSTQKMLKSQQLHEDLLQSIADKQPEKAWSFARSIALRK